MTQHGGPHPEAQLGPPLRQVVGQGLRPWFVSLGDDDDAVGLAPQVRVLQGTGHLFQIGLHFWTEDHFGTTGYAAHEGQIATITAHNLDDETTAGRHGRLFDLIHGVHNVVYSGIRADTQFRSREVIIDRRREANHRQIKRRKISPFAEQSMGCIISCPTTNDKQTIHLATGDSIRITHIEANYERGLSLDILGYGGVNDYRKDFPIFRNTTLIVRKDNHKFAELPIRISKRKSRGDKKAGNLRRIDGFVIETRGHRMLLSNGETLEVIRGDKLKIVDVLPTTHRSSGIKVNFKGFVGDKKNNTGEDRGYAIDTGTALMK